LGIKSLLGNSRNPKSDPAEPGARLVYNKRLSFLNSLNGELGLLRECGSTAVSPRGKSFQSLKYSVAIIIGIVIAYQITTLGRQGLWYDEIYTVLVTRPERSLAEIFQRDLLIEETPPLRYLMMHFWQLLAPRGDWAMRFPGLFFYILTIAVATLYRCRAKNTAKRIVFVALVGCSFGTIYFAQEVRTYYVFGLLAICILYDALDHATVLDDGSVPSWARLGWSAVVGLGASYSHYFGFLFFGTTILALLGYSVARGQIAWRIIALGSSKMSAFHELRSNTMLNFINHSTQKPKASWREPAA
jgi:hypothetical protein